MAINILESIKCSWLDKQCRRLLTIYESFIRHYDSA